MPGNDLLLTLFLCFLCLFSFFTQQITMALIEQQEKSRQCKLSPSKTQALDYKTDIPQFHQWFTASTGLLLTSAAVTMSR